MKRSGIAIILLFFIIYACQTNSDSKSMDTSSETVMSNLTLERSLDDGRSVQIKSYSLEKGEASNALVKKGVSDILDKMADLYITQIKLNHTAALAGTCNYTFRIEPNGMFRMIQEGHRTVIEENFAPLKEAFLVSAMAHDFTFPATGGQLVVKVEFEFK